jgi:hypothetical protein
MSEETIESSFPVSGQARLSLGNIRGAVNIQPGEDELISVTAVKHLDSGNAEDTRVEMKQNEDGSVVVKTHYASDIKGRIFNMGKPCKVDYDVHVPAACWLDISGVSNTTSVRGVSGQIALKTVSGSLTIQEVNGEIEFTTVSGDVSGDILSGPSLQFNSVSGDVTLNQADFPAIKGKTVSGDLQIETPLGEGPYNFNSVSGDFLLIVPGDTHCTAKVSGISGSFKSLLPLTSDRRKNGKHFAEVQGGGVQVNLNTVSGDLIIKPRQGEEVNTDIHSPDRPNRSNRAEILDKIERGEMSVEDGIQALKS